MSHSVPETSSATLFSTANLNVSTALWIATIQGEPSSSQFNFTKHGQRLLLQKFMFQMTNEPLGA
jgi:hypothetical protein